MSTCCFCSFGKNVDYRTFFVQSYTHDSHDPIFFSFSSIRACPVCGGRNPNREHLANHFMAVTFLPLFSPPPLQSYRQCWFLKKWRTMWMQDYCFSWRATEKQHCIDRGQTWKAGAFLHSQITTRKDHLLIKILTCRGVVAQSVERPSKVPVWRNSTVGSNHERDMSSLSHWSCRGIRW